MSSHSPWFILVGGINGAGKSTFAQGRASIQSFSSDVGANLEVINPDLFTKEIQCLNPRISLARANIQAAVACETRVRQIISEGTQSFAIETVLSTDKYKSIVESALANGYRVQFVYVMVGSVEEAIKRVKLRVSKGGHNVPKSKIRSRWSKSLANVRWFWEHSTGAWVFFNGDRVNEPKLIASRDNSGVTFDPDSLSLLLP